MSPPVGPKGPGRDDDAVVRLGLNESAYGPLPAVADVLRKVVSDTNRYPDFMPDDTRARIAQHLRLPAAQVTVGAGATGVALAVLQAALRRGAALGIDAPEMLTATPTFDGYPILAGMLGMRLEAVPLDDVGRVDLAAMRAAVTARTVAVVVCSPHNPTGSVVDESELHEFVRSLPAGVVVVFDEAYVEFSRHSPDLWRLIRTFDDLLVLRTFSKAYGLAALRVGYGVGGRQIVTEARRFELPFGVGSAAIAAVPVALSAEDELAQRVRSMRAERDRMADMLRAIGCPVLPSEGNFLFLPGVEGVAIGHLLRGCGVSTKECRGHGTRITVGDRSSTDYLVGSLRLTAQTA